MKGRYMGNGSTAHRVRRLAALTVVVALLSTAPAYGAPTAAEPTVTHTAPKVSTPSATHTRPPASNSEIAVPEDPRTLQFRKDLAAKQKKLDDFMAQLDALDRELEIATESYNASIDQLSEMKSRVDVAQGDLTQAKLAYEMQAEILGTRASSMYRDGSLAAVEVLLDAKSVSDFMSRVKFLNTIGVADADIAKSLRGQKELLEGQVDELKATQAVAESLEFELKARQIEIMLRIQERQDMVNKAQKDIRELLDSEDARRQTEQSVASRRNPLGRQREGHRRRDGQPGRDRAWLPRRAVPVGRREAQRL